MGAITFYPNIPNNYREAVDVLTNSPTFANLVVRADRIEITAGAQFGPGSTPAWSRQTLDGWQANVHPTAGVLIGGRMATLREMIAHELVHGDLFDGPSSLSRRLDPVARLENEAQVIGVVNQIRTDLGYPASYLRTDLGSGPINGIPIQCEM